MAARQPAKKPAAPSVPAGAVKVVDLPDNKAAQVNEAMEETVPFVMSDGTVFTFKPPVDWSYNTDFAFVRGDIVNWARGALEDPEQLEAFLDAPARAVGRIIRYYDDRAGVTRGEASSSSPS
ncbi:hypothetical protein ACOQFV_09075 [Nocardiopsis changdeensis]|uniref:Tail assembly chaperone n=1 Tax=Nocardiopsis changdeensis TaxID=2831969 RepID=A0ABX8BDS0_9ACTN|nr:MULTISPECIES: hypothetical protein [Nocardiopsis]QUX20306.1 hypothetical protein KGD84_17405 [Nocardiopsis changdeensis]QYX36236.1 hypothetical protein K1J57_26860 [Nocardiopsis sp. MT53]